MVLCSNKLKSDKNLAKDKIYVIENLILNFVIENICLISKSKVKVTD